VRSAAVDNLTSSAGDDAGVVPMPFSVSPRRCAISATISA
jgi:hypothetical protein